MENKELTCSGCGKKVTNTAGTIVFKCPSCDSADIVRCKHCRQMASKFRCHSCGFEGPN